MHAPRGRAVGDQLSQNAGAQPAPTTQHMRTPRLPLPPSPPSSPPLTHASFLDWLHDARTLTVARKFSAVCDLLPLPTGLFSHENESGLQRLISHGQPGASLKGLNMSKVLNLSRSVWRSPLRPNATRRRTCAVVGSSSNLLERYDGAAIDAADWVVRINNAPTPANLSAHVGSRTDVYVNSFSTKRALCKATPTGTDQWHVTGSHCASSTQVFYCMVRLRRRLTARAPYVAALH